ncbi:putative RNA methyltransferase slr0064 [Porphyridium purpureum]|uniref:Putative RNA methyltransferase slr0064 n=1 Tax=Porphyridium purpureum TaxID=35688 RepID=A0A5J4Z2E4_PORPP|nr:putative RNA methyltransferase slr0064 [Porphyridium purpureum]|eukprot:POR7009..scf208_2
MAGLESGWNRTGGGRDFSAKREGRGSVDRQRRVSRAPPAPYPAPSDATVRQNEEFWRDQVPVGHTVFFATCARGLGEYLAMELDPQYERAGQRQFGTIVHQVLPSGVFFSANALAGGYAASLWSRTATRVLAELAVLELPENPDASPAQEVYEAVQNAVDWSAVVLPGMTISVTTRVALGEMLNQNTLRIRVKDAVCDALRAAVGEKPLPPAENVQANVPLFITLNRTELRVYRDLAGASLHKRGYKGESAMHRSSLNETVAAGMLYMSGATPTELVPDISKRFQGSKKKPVVVDPMCGSGTLLCEAALLDLQIAPGLFRQEFCFECWPDHDAKAFQALLDHAHDCRREAARFDFWGNDVHGASVRLAQKGSVRAGLDDVIRWTNSDVLDVPRPGEVSMTGLAWTCGAVVLTLSNPPWGMRLNDGSDELFSSDAAYDGDDQSDMGTEQSWKALGNFLRECAPESSAYLLSGSSFYSRFLRLKADRRMPVRIGNVDCRVLKYDIGPRRFPARKSPSA